MYARKARVESGNVVARLLVTDPSIATQIQGVDSRTLAVAHRRASELANDPGPKPVINTGETPVVPTGTKFLPGLKNPQSSHSDDYRAKHPADAR